MNTSMGKVRKNRSCGVCGGGMPAGGGYGMVSESDSLLYSQVTFALKPGDDASFDECACSIQCAAAHYQMRLAGLSGGAGNPEEGI